MPIFDDIISPKLVWPVEARWPLRRAQALLERFRARFPDIYFDLYWETRLMNAQAYIGEKGRSVRLYGGLGRHRRVGIEASPSLSRMKSATTSAAAASRVLHHHQQRGARQRMGRGPWSADGVRRHRCSRYSCRGVAQLAKIWKKYQIEYEYAS